MSLRKRLRHLAEYMGARIVLGFCALFPLGLLRRVGAALGWITYRMIGIRRRVTVENIAASFPEFDREKVERIALESYKNFGRSMMETSRFPRMSENELWKMVTVEGDEHPRQALREGRGAIIFTGHFGNWELLGATIAHGGFPVYGTDTRHSNDMTHQMIIDLRRSQGVQVLEPDEPFSGMVRMLSENQFIAYLADQDGGRDGIFVDFLGRPASTRRGLALLALRSGSPIAPVFIIREGESRHRVIYHELVRPDPRLKGGEAAADLTQRCTRLLEDVIHRHPESYFWMHRRWKSKPPEPVA
jgi:KDO2-lipid IV(A) lauroyltransferase